MKCTGRSLLSTFSGRVRSYAVQAASKPAQQKPSYPVQDPKVTKLPNGTLVASLENYSPISRVAVIYNAGSRYEPIRNLGLTHCLRACSNLSSQKATSFGIARNLQQMGASLSCTTTREHMMYTLNCKRSDLGNAVEFLADVAIAPAFKTWELVKLDRHLQLDLELLNQSSDGRLMEAIHKAAYRDTLGQSLYMTADRIGSFTPETLESFVKAQYVSGNMAVAGVGIDHETLVGLVDKMGIRQGSAPAGSNKAKYHGGEIRIETKDDLVHAAVVAESASGLNADVMSLFVLSMALGTGPYVHHGSGTALSRLNKALANATNTTFAARSMMSCYSDSGLFGVHLVANSKDAGKVLKAAVDELKRVSTSGITEEELQAAKRKLYSVVYDDDELVNAVGNEALLTGQVLSWADFDKVMNATTLDSVNKVAKQLMTGRPTMAAVGNLANVPYLDEIL